MASHAGTRPSPGSLALGRGALDALERAAPRPRGGQPGSPLATPALRAKRCSGRRNCCHARPCGPQRLPKRTCTTRSLSPTGAVRMSWDVKQGLLRTFLLTFALSQKVDWAPRAVSLVDTWPRL